ncbi:MAG: hypothetical protein JWN34_2130 [Bryobacterales bacterium]|nr:hypothetical protein [Bryobacterales bacterium]
MRRLTIIIGLAVNGLLQTVHGQEPSSPNAGTWRDPATGLTWAAADNGVGVSASQAALYCSTLTLSGRKDWRLPDIEELQTLFGGSGDDHGHHTIGPIRVTGWAWSSTPGQQRGEQWALDFGDGGRASAVTGDSGLNRALCVQVAIQKVSVRQ